MHPNQFNVQIEVENQGYAVRHIGHKARYFSSFEELTTYLRDYLPIYPVYAGGNEAASPDSLAAR